MAKDGWQDVEASDVNEADIPWVKPEKGVVIVGIIDRAFLVKQDDGKLTASYGFIDATVNGESASDSGGLNLGERFAFKEQIREMKLGDKVELTFVEEKSLKKNHTQWVVKIRRQPIGKGDKVYDVLMADYNKRYNPDNEKEGDNIPF